MDCICCAKTQEGKKELDSFRRIDVAVLQTTTVHHKQAFFAGSPTAMLDGGGGFATQRRGVFKLCCLTTSRDVQPLSSDSVFSRCLQPLSDVAVPRCHRIPTQKRSNARDICLWSGW